MTDVEKNVRSGYPVEIWFSPEGSPPHPFDLVVREVKPPHEPHPSEGVGVQGGHGVVVQMKHSKQAVPREDPPVDLRDLVVGAVQPEHPAQLREEVWLQLRDQVVGHVQVLQVGLGLERVPRERLDLVLVQAKAEDAKIRLLS